MGKEFFGSQFHTDGFNYPYWVERSEKGGGIMLLFREDYHLTFCWLIKVMKSYLRKQSG